METVLQRLKFKVKNKYLKEKKKKRKNNINE